MRLSPFEIVKAVNNAIKNKDKYQARVEEIRANPLKGKSGRALAIYDLENARISRIICSGVDKKILEEITHAVNDAFDRADNVWQEFEK